MFEQLFPAFSKDEMVPLIAYANTIAEDQIVDESTEHTIMQVLLNSLNHFLNEQEINHKLGYLFQLMNLNGFVHIGQALSLNDPHKHTLLRSTSPSPVMFLPFRDIQVFPEVSALLEFPVTPAFNYYQLLCGIEEEGIPPLIDRVAVVSPDYDVKVQDADELDTVFDSFTRTLLIRTALSTEWRLSEDPLLLVTKIMKAGLQSWIEQTHPEAPDLEVKREIQLFAYQFLVNIHSFLEQEWFKGRKIERKITPRSTATWHKKIVQAMTPEEGHAVIKEKGQYLKAVKDNYIAFYRQAILQLNESLALDRLDESFRLLDYFKTNRTG